MDTKVGKRQMSRILNAAVKRKCSELEFENALALASIEHSTKNIENHLSSSVNNQGCEFNLDDDTCISGNSIYLNSSDSSTCYSDGDFNNNSKQEQFDYTTNDIDSTQPETNISVKENLALWAIKHSITHAAINDLLKILSPVFPSLPKDARTLLNTPREIDFKTLSNGNYYYFGLLKGIKKSVESYKNISCEKEIELDFNIDGIPLYSSSNTSFWPILARITKDFQKPFTVGIFCGDKKPPLNEFLCPFISEIKDLLVNGININNVAYKVKVRAFICDAPARAYLKCVKSHSGYSSCERCVAEGEYFAGRVTFPTTKSASRTDSSFAVQADEDHHVGLSPLTQIPGLGMVTSFVLDYMHLICLGVMRKMLFQWILGKSLILKFSSRVVDEISQDLMQLSVYIPTEFARKPRTLREVRRWKATEFRQFLLYTGVLVLKNKANLAIYQNFLLLHSAIFILIHEIPEIKSAEQFLNIFVSHSLELYGQEFCSYNVHNLLHIVEDVKRFGPLDKFSCFPFESFLGQLKGKLRSKAKPLQQIVKRILETDTEVNFRSETTELKKLHSSGPVPNNLEGSQFQELVTPSFTLKSNNAANSCCFINNCICVAQNFIECNTKKIIIYKKFKRMSDVYDYPISSRKLGIYCVSGLSTDLYNASIEDIQYKCMLLKFKNEFFCFQLKH